MNSTPKAKQRSGQRLKKRKFTGNIHTRKIVSKPMVPESLSASGKKTSNVHLECDNFQGYRIFDINLLMEVVEANLACKTCGGKVKLSEISTYGLSSTYSMNCTNCDFEASFRNTKMIGKKNNIPEINRRFVYAMRCVGQGLSAMNVFCGIMDFPKPVKQKSYDSIVKVLLSASTDVAEESMCHAAVDEKSSSDSSEIVVSGDGTWKTRGHTSKIGVCTVIGDITGKVIDKEVLSTFCKKCDSWKTRKGTAEYKKWKSSHSSTDCLKDHDGTAGKMEVVGMLRIFKRSEEKRFVKYVRYIGDGDSKTFQSIVAEKPYGDITIEKIECVGRRTGTSS